MRQIQIYLTVYFLSVFAAQAQTATNDWSKRIVSKSRHTLESLLSPHASPIRVLIIDGKRFEHVRGLKKFYLPIPNTNSIVFVTDDDKHNPTYHIFNMDNDEDRAIYSNSSLSSFGNRIGSDYLEDSVEVETNGIVRLCSSTRFPKNVLAANDKIYGFDTFCYLDLKKRTVEEKTRYYDKDGKVIDER